MSGRVRKKISLSRTSVESGIESLIARQIRIADKIKEGCAFTEDECEERLSLIRERDRVEYILNTLFDIQGYQYMRSDYGGVEIGGSKHQ